MASTFHGFVGQESTINHIHTQMKGARALGKPCPHLLLIGPSGMGKTKLAKAIAKGAGTNLRIVHGYADPSDLCVELVQMQSFDFLLLDEAHTLPRKSQEAIYEVIDSSRMSNRLPKQGNPNPNLNTDSDGKLVIEPISVVVATNKPSYILEALYRRMELTVYLHEYPLEELSYIANKKAIELNLLFDPFALDWVARASQGQPRRVIQIIEGMKRLFYNERRELKEEDVAHYLTSSGRDVNGLDQEQIMYLTKLFEMGHNGSASINTISALMSLEREYVEDKIESGLLRMGLVGKGVSGRSLTEKGVKLLSTYHNSRNTKKLESKNTVSDPEKGGE